MNEQLAVALQNRLSELERVCQLVRQLGDRHRLPAQVVFALNLSLDEVLTNVISYAYDDTDLHEIIVRVSLRTGELVVEVEDDGRAFNPLHVATPDIEAPVEERKVGGLGVHLVRTIMDGLEYQRHRGKNRLLMKKAVVAQWSEKSATDSSQGDAEMEIWETKQDGIVVLGLKGRLDASNAGTLEERIRALISGGQHRLVIDLAQLDYISSAGLRVLLVAAKQLKANNGQLALASLQERIKEVFDIAGFSSIFRIYPSRQEAAAGI